MPIEYKIAIDPDKNDTVKYLIKSKGPGLDTLIISENSKIEIDSTLFKPESEYSLEGKVISGKDTIDFSDGIIKFFTPKKTSVDVVNKLSIPSKYFLSQNCPNPFNSSTKINYELKKTEDVSLKVYDVLGREIKTLVNSHLPKGNYEVDFNALNLPSGVYFYRLQAGDFVEAKKMILSKWLINFLLKFLELLNNIYTNI